MAWKQIGKAKSNAAGALSADVAGRPWLFRGIRSAYGLREGANELAWTVDFKRESLGFEVIGRHGGTGLFVERLDERSTLYGVSVATGKVAWKCPLEIQAKAMAVHDDDVLLLGVNAGRRYVVQRLDARSGTPGEVRPAKSGTQLFTYGDRIYVTGNESPLWAAPVKGGEFSKAAPSLIRSASMREHIIYCATMNVDDDTIGVMCWDARAKRITGTVDLGEDKGALRLAPTATPGRVAVGIWESRAICMIDVQQTKMVWTNTLGHPVNSLVAGNFGVAAVVAELDGEQTRLVILDADSGEEREAPTKMSLPLPLFGTDDRLIVFKPSSIESYAWQGSRRRFG